jgi:hypothetical protein
MLTFSSGIHIVVWEEVYWRWMALNETITKAVVDPHLEGSDSARRVPIASQVRMFSRVQEVTY